MEVRIHGSNSFTVSNRMRGYIEKKVEKLHYFKSHINEINFHLSSEKLIYRITATMSINKFGVNKFEATAGEMYTAIDKIIHKMDVKINREKSKIQNHNNLNHQELVNFFFEHQEDKPEPTKSVSVNSKPATLMDAYMQMEMDKNDFYGFNLIHENDHVAPAFLRKLEDNVIYLFRKDGNGLYSEFSLKKEGDDIKEDQKIRELLLKEMNLLDAQKDVLNQDYPFNIYVDNEKRVSFLYKEGNGKWQLIS